MQNYFNVTRFLGSDELMCFKFVKNMKRFVLILVFFSGLLSQKGLSEKLESQEQLLKEKKFNLGNEADIQRNPVSEDPLINNAACRCTNGKCVMEDGKEVCKCPPGFGNFTSTSCKACGCGPDSNCMWTTGLAGYKICFCTPGYGDKKGKCVACDCGPDSNCTFTDPGIYKSMKKDCICKPGYTDQNGKCVGPCSKNPCKNGGNCKDAKNGYECVCPTNYSGKNCTVKATPCSSNPCENGGKCTDSGKSFTCACEKPYSGPKCETTPCSSNPCQNNGTCNVDGESYRCKCKTPFNGTNCETDPCSPSPCGNGGKCKINGKSFTCDCPDTFVGETCEHECNCKNGKCRVTSDNDILCECLPEYGKKSDDCIACDCGTGANCTWKSGWFSDNKYCLCPDGSKLEEKHCEDPCNSNPCLNNGKCKVDGKAFKCECRPPYTGLTCNEEASTSTIPPTETTLSTKKTVTPVLSTKTAITTTPLMSTSQVFTETTTRTFTEEINMTSYEPSNFTYDFNETTYEPSNFTYDFNRTTYEPSDFTADFNNTTYEPSDFTADFNNTTNEPSNFTGDFNSTTYEPSNFTADFNNTTYDPSNFTYDFNQTTYEPSNFTYDVNMTSYEPSNITNENNTSETTPSLSTTTTPSTTVPTKIPDICNDDVCVHGKCEIAGRYYRCRCFEGFTGLLCEDRIQNKSDKQIFWQIIQTSILIFVLILLSVVVCILLRKKK